MNPPILNKVHAWALSNEGTNGIGFRYPLSAPGTTHACRIDYRAQLQEEEIMKKSNDKTSLTRKATAIASAAMTLATAAVLAMAPTSEAQAVGLKVAKKNCTSKGCTYEMRAEGGSRISKADALKNARSIVGCPAGAQFQNGSGRLGVQLDWYNKTWFSADYLFRCVSTNKGDPTEAGPNQKHTPRS